MLTRKKGIFSLIILFCIIILAAVLRFFELGLVPPGFTNDEANNGYDAYSILKTGKDQWGTKQPATYLSGFGDNRLPIYTYTVVPSISVFGLNEFATRFPSSLFGTLTVLVVYFLGKKLFKNVSFGLVSAFLLAINPWHVAMSRVGIESNLSVFVLSLAVLVFLKSLENPKLIYLSLLFFVISVYTYTANTVLTPLFLGVLLFIYREKFESKKMILAVILLFIVALIPLYQNGRFKTASSRASQVNFLNDRGLIDLVNEKQGECRRKILPFYCQLIVNKYSAYGEQFIVNYISHFSPEYLAISGSETQYSALQKHGVLYISEYLFFLIGIFFLFKNKDNAARAILAWLFLAPLADSVTGTGHYSRYLVVLPSIQLVAAYGVGKIWSLTRNKFWLLAIFSFAIFEIFVFLTEYFTYFPVFYSQYSQYGYKQLFSYVTANQQEYSSIIFSSRINDTKQYIYYLFYTKYDPLTYQKLHKPTELETNGWIRVEKVDNLYFLPSISIPEEVMKEGKPNILFVGAPGEFPSKVISRSEVKDLQGNVIFKLVDLRDNPSLFPQYRKSLLTQ